MARKRCTKCKELKAFSKFSKSQASKDGYQTWCKDCVALNGCQCRQRRKSMVADEPQTQTTEEPQTQTTEEPQTQTTEEPKPAPVTVEATREKFTDAVRQLLLSMCADQVLATEEFFRTTPRPSEQARLLQRILTVGTFGKTYEPLLQAFSVVIREDLKAPSGVDKYPPGLFIVRKGVTYCMTHNQKRVALIDPTGRNQSARYDASDIPATLKQAHAFVMAITRRPVILNLLTRFEYEMNKRALAAKAAKANDGDDGDDMDDDWDDEVD